MKLIYAITILAVILVVGCASKKNKKTAAESVSATPPKQEQEVTGDLPIGAPYTMLEYSSGMCYGKCPVYNISINSDGTIEYFGKMHVDKLGTYKKELTKRELASLYTELKAMNLFQYDDEYGARVMDISKQEITYREAGKEKKIMCKLGHPAELIALIKKVNSIANSTDHWQLIEPHPDRPVNKNPTDRTVYDEVIVHVSKDFDLKKWVTQYKSYDMTIKKSLSPNGFMWVLGFNPDKIEGAHMVALLRDDPDIQKADLNKKVQPRR